MIEPTKNPSTGTFVADLTAGSIVFLLALTTVLPRCRDGLWCKVSAVLGTSGAGSSVELLSDPSVVLTQVSAVHRRRRQPLSWPRLLHWVLLKLSSWHWLSGASFKSVWGWQRERISEFVSGVFSLQCDSKVCWQRSAPSWS